MGMPLLDAVIIFGSLALVNYFWVMVIRQGEAFDYLLVNISLPGFSLVFLLSATLAGIYDKKYKPYKAMYSSLVAIIVMLAVYSMLPERFRFSRGVIFFGGITALINIALFRWILVKNNLVEDRDETKKSRQTVIVGTKEEYEETVGLLEKAGLSHRIIGRVATNGKKENALGSLADLNTLVESIGVKELIFCGGKLKYGTIIKLLQQLPGNLSIRFHSFGSKSIVGSDSKDTSGEFVSEDANFQMNDPYQRRMKRLADIAFSVFLFVTFPVHLFTVGFDFLKSAFGVLIGKKTWIGYYEADKKLPALKPAIFTATGETPGSGKKVKESSAQIDYWYAMQYEWKHDVKLMIKYYKNLDTSAGLQKG